jgi:hypothetical protein
VFRKSLLQAASIEPARMSENNLYAIFFIVFYLEGYTYTGTDDS